MTLRTSQPQNGVVAARKSTAMLDGNKIYVPPHEIDDLMAQLAAATEAGDSIAFALAYEQIDWAKRTADEYETVVHWAITAGAPLIARSLSAAGAERFPEHEYLPRAARVLAPPTVRQSKSPADPSRRANHEWLKANQAEYRGQWVALQKGKLLASGDSLKAVTDQVAIAPTILFTVV